MAITASFGGATATAADPDAIAARKQLDRIYGLIANGYGPAHIAAAAIIAADSTVHGASVDDLDNFDGDCDEPIGLASAARDLIEDGVVTENRSGQLAIEPYDDL